MLTEQQQAFITSSISHLLDLPAEPSDLLAYIQDLYNALISPVIAENHEHALLHNCLYQPEETLSRLEDQSADSHNLTVGEIQKFIIHWLSEQVGNTPDTRVIWKQDELEANVISTANMNKVFITNRTVDSGDILDLYNLEIGYDKNYSGRLVAEHSNVYLELTINYSEAEQHCGRALIDYIHNYSELNEEERASEPLRFKTYATKQAATFAAKYTFDHLLHHGIVDFEYALTLECYEEPPLSFQMMNLLTNKNFLSLLKSRTVAFTEIRSISINDSKRLLQQTILSLLASSKLNINAALAMTPQTLNVLSTPYFRTLIENDIKLLDKITGISKEQASLLSNPNITNLMNEGRLTLDIALQLNKSYARLLSDPFLLNLAKKDVIDWENLNKYVNKYTCDLFLHRKAISLFSTYDIPFNDICNYLPAIIEETRGQRTRNLLASSHLSIGNMLRLSDEVIVVIEKHPKLSIWIKCGMLNAGDCHEPSAINFICLVYYNRMMAIYKSNPYRYDEVPDSVDCIIADILSEEAQCQNYIHENFLRVFILTVLNDLDRELDNDYLPATIREVYQTLNEIINFASDNFNQTCVPTYWNDCLTRCIHAISNLHIPQQTNEDKVRSSGLSFFEARHSQQAVTDFMSFCYKLREIQPLCECMRPRPELALVNS